MTSPDIKALGRLGTGVQAGPPGRRRRRRAAGARRHRISARTVAVAMVAALAMAWLGLSVRPDPQASLAAVPAAPAPQVATATDGSLPARLSDTGFRVSRDATGTRGRPFAMVGGLTLTLPYPDPVLVAFHEASQVAALALDPVGRLVANDNATKFTAGEDRPGPAYRILSSRGRARPATSAVDVVVPEGAIVSAPVSGTVVEVREYVLYGYQRDWRVVIEPAGRSDLAVVMIHLHRPRVAVGDHVQAGTTPVGAARLLAFASHVDYHLEEELPHVHIEVKPAGSPAPLDPNAPALLPEDDPAL